jgi:protocatechuate 3,4-dioxygenase alpha subunit
MSTVGPFFKLLVRDRADEGTDSLVTAATRGQRITIEGTLFDGAGAPVLDGLVEIWQADADGNYRHPADPGASGTDPAFPGYGRASTGDAGRFAFHTILPGRVAGPGGEDAAGALQAPHILVSVMARGIMTRCWTRIYFADREDENADDPVLRLVPRERRGTLLARREGDTTYRIDIRLQGDEETVFFNA